MSYTLRITFSLADTAEDTLDFLAALVGLRFDTREEATDAAERLIEELYERDTYGAEVAVQELTGFRLKVTNESETRDLTSLDLLGDHYESRFESAEQAMKVASTIQRDLPPGYVVKVADV